MSTFLEWLSTQTHRKDELGFIARNLGDYPELRAQLVDAEAALPALQARGKVGLFAKGAFVAVREWLCAGNGRHVPRPLIENASGVAIRSVEDWLELAPPKRGEAQWKDYRSAKELAKAWFPDPGSGPAVPDDLAFLFRSHGTTERLAIETGIPELVTRLDRLRGEGRNTDMVLVGNAGAERIVVAIEAKADEAFGPLVGEYVAAAVGRNPRSRVELRARVLLNSLFGAADDPAHCPLRYQLVHAAAAALIEAGKRQADVAVFIVHEFLCAGRVGAEKVRRNSEDFDVFLRRFRPAAEATAAGTLHGPFEVPGGEFVPSGLPLFVGKVTTHLA